MSASQWQGWRKGVATAKGTAKRSPMNKTEEAYANRLETLKRLGEIQWYKFEGIKLRLGEGAYFTPDFFVMTSNFSLEVHEVKGFWREAAKVRIKAASEMYPFRFIAARKNGITWETEEF